MYRFSLVSAHRLETCHEDIIRVFYEVIRVMDCSVLYGFRNEHDQNMVFDRGFSQLMWDKSTHNKVPSEGVDCIPYPVDYENLYAFHKLAGIVLGVAHEIGIDIQWGGDWKTFKDLGHYQLNRRLL